jgi:acetate kinase
MQGSKKILVYDAGSSSHKFGLFEAEGEELLAEGSIDWTTKPTRLVFHCQAQPEVREELNLQKHQDAAARILDDLRAGSACSQSCPSAHPGSSGRSWTHE